MSRALLLLFLLTGCATVKAVRLEPDWDTTDRSRIKRLAVVTSVAWHVPGQPAIQPPEQLRQLWSLMARRYVNQKRDFIAKKDAVAEPNGQAEGIDVFAPRAFCQDGVEAVLWLDPKVDKQGDGVEAECTAQLDRCSDGAVIWEAKGGGSWPSDDKLLTEQTAMYVGKFGPEVGPYVAPSFRLLKALLDTLPNPVLSDEDKDEKIALDD